jgi:hypothetical protein
MSAFIELCKLIEEKHDISFYSPGDAPDNKTKVSEDDGMLQVYYRGEWAAFGIGQDRPLREQNDRITVVLTILKMEKWLKVEYVLHRQDDIEREEQESDDVCPHCGRSNCD